MWLVFLVLLAIAIAAYRSATTTTIVLVRHAEKLQGTDPPLAPEGERRAERLAALFGGVRGSGAIQAIYVTDTKRAEQMAAPLAVRLGLIPIVLPTAAADATVSRVLDENRGGRALIVGHSNTIPEMVRDLSGVSIPPIPNDEYDDIYIVSVPTFGKAGVLRLKY